MPGSPYIGEFCRGGYQAALTQLVVGNSHLMSLVDYDLRIGSAKCGIAARFPRLIATWVRGRNAAAYRGQWAGSAWFFIPDSVPPQRG